MINRVKMRFKALSPVGIGNGASEGVKIKIRRCLTRSLAAFIIILTLVLPSAASDHATRTITLLSSGVKTAATAQSTAFDVSAYQEGQILVDVTVEASTSTLDIVIQTSPDNVTWYTHTTISQITATGQYRQAITNFGKYLRISYTVGGTSYTFSVVGVFKN